MKELHFTIYVLGSKGAHRLKTKRITQTLRSRTSSIVKAGVKAGDEVLVLLDGADLGIVRINQIDKLTFNQIFLGDALQGGFDNLEELTQALKRAGYRFKPLMEYQLFRIRFEWP